MALTIAETWTSRERFRADLREALTLAVAGAVAQVPGGEWDGVPVVTEKALRETLARLLDSPLPPVDEHTAEVRTTSYVTVWAKCPNCGIHMAIPLSISPQLVLEAGVGELKLKAKSKGRIHVCNQLTLDEPAADQGEFSLGDIIGEGDEDTSVSDDAEPDDRAADALACVGSNHVPGHSAGCPMFTAPDAETLQPRVGDPIVVDGHKVRIKSIATDGFIHAKAAFGDDVWDGPSTDLRWDDSVGVWRNAGA